MNFRAALTSGEQPCLRVNSFPSCDAEGQDALHRAVAEGLLELCRGIGPHQHSEEEQTLLGLFPP